MIYPSIVNISNPETTKFVSAAEYQSRRYPFRSCISAPNSIIIEIINWLRENRIGYDWTGTFSTYKKDANKVEELNFRFSKEEDVLAFKLRWE